MHLIWFFGLICLSAVSVISQSDMFHLPKRQDETRRFCGTNLANTLALLCQGAYNGWTTKAKKDESWIEMTADNYDQPPLPEWPFISHELAASFAPRDAPNYRRYRRGVYDECCRKPCSFTVLQKYCAPIV